MDATVDAPDLLRGLPAVARHLGMSLRSARHWHDREILPTFKIGDLICARRSTLTAWLVAAEARGLHRGKSAVDEPSEADDVDDAAA